MYDQPGMSEIAIREKVKGMGQERMEQGEIVVENTVNDHSWMANENQQYHS